MRKFFTLAFADYAGERAIKTILQTLIAGGLLGAGLFELQWFEIASLSGGTGLLSIATAVLLYKGDGTDNPDDTDNDIAD